MLFSAFSQQTYTKKYQKEAKKTFDEGKYFESSEKCAEAFTKMGAKGSLQHKGDFAYMTAESFRFIENYKESLKWYEKAIELKYYESKPEIYLHKGNMQFMLGDIKMAKKSYTRLKKLLSNTKDPLLNLAENGITSCKKTKEFELDQKRYIIKNESGLNKKEMDMASIVYGTRKNMMYLSSTRKGSTGDATDPISGEKYMDIWVSLLDKKGNWGEPTLLPGDVNTQFSEGMVSFTNNFKTMLFTRCPVVEKQNLGCDIYMATYKSKKWGKSLKLNLKSSDSISVGHPCVLPGGTKTKFELIFASDLPGGFGGKDLWQASFSYNKKKKSWFRDTVFNMGPKINTKGNELFPTLGVDGQLYFSSNGLVGVGGLDIFSIEKVDGKWNGDPVNMGLPLNSNKNDYYLYDVDGVSGYFTSEKGGDPDIYSYKLPPNLFDLRVVVSERGTGKRISDATVKLISVTDGKEIDSRSTTRSGRVRWEKTPKGDRIILGNKEYKVSAFKEEYIDDGKGVTVKTIGLKRSKSFSVELTLLPEKEIKLTEVQYVRNEWTFINDSTCMSLDSINDTYEMLKDFPKVVIKIFSHTDARGSDEKNRTLSENRARKYYTELVNMGIDPRRIVPEGKGETQPRKWMDPETGTEVILNENYINQFKKTDPVKYEHLHQLNRRTTAKVLKKDFNSKTYPPGPSLEENPFYDKYLDY